MNNDNSSRREKLNEIKDLILKALPGYRNASFIEIDNLLKGKGYFEEEKGFSAELCWKFLPPWNKIKCLMWSSDNQFLMEAMRELLEEGKVIATPTDVLMYALDGGLLQLPIFDKEEMSKIKRNPKKYEGDYYWLPTRLNVPYVEQTLYPKRYKKWKDKFKGEYQ